MWFRKAYFITLTLAVRRNPHLSQQAPVFAERRDDISEEEASVARRHRALLHDCVEQLVVSRIPSFSAETVDDSAENVDEAQTEDIYGNLVFTTNNRLFTSCSFWLIFPRNSVFLEFWEGQLWLGLMQIPKNDPRWVCCRTEFVLGKQCRHQLHLELHKTYGNIKDRTNRVIPHSIPEWSPFKFTLNSLCFLVASKRISIVLKSSVETVSK